MALANLPPDVLRFLSRRYLCDQERLTVSTVCRVWHECCGIDVPHVLLEHILSVDGQDGFRTSRNGYKYVHPIPTPMACPHRLGALASSDPWSFVRQWLVLPWACKDDILGRHVLAWLSIYSSTWSEDVAVSFFLLTRTPRVLHVESSLKQAAWRCRRDVLRCLLHTPGAVDVDFDDGTLLRLALCTLGHENSEDTVVEFLDEVLQAGADTTRHNSWAIRLCLYNGYYVAATLLCLYTERSHLEALVGELQMDPGTDNVDIAMLTEILAEI